MLLRRFASLLVLAIPLALAMSWTVLEPTPAYAQDDDDDTGGDDDSGDDVSGLAGVVVDADGVLRRRTWKDPSGQLARQRAAAARAALDPDLAKKSPLRKISLNRLERILAERVAKNQGVTDEMKYLAGLTRVRYVFYYPETQDIVLAGPAEGWAVDPTGRPLGIESGRPLIELQDLIVALRTYAPRQKDNTVITCSIDPTKEGLAEMQAFLRSIGSNIPPTPQNAQFVVSGLRRSLGLQNVRITGIPANTHFAQVLVEADYRMKLIGIGMEQPPVQITSYVSKAKPASVARNALQRWYFVPNYQCVRVSEDENAMQLVGDGVKLVGADELVTADGSRQVSGRADKASKLFVESFTRKYPELADRSPIYAQLRNLIDLSVAAAFIQSQDYYGEAGWDLGAFADEGAYAVQTVNAPQKVQTAVTAVFRGSSWMTPIGGGVKIKPKEALATENLLKDEDGAVAVIRDQDDLSSLKADQWWWD